MARFHGDGGVKLYTKTGDSGQTGLLGGGRVSKADARVEAYGELDETNAAVGLAATAAADDDVGRMLRAIQDDLFVLGAELASPAGAGDVAKIGPDQVTRLEAWIDAAAAEAPPLRQFILPGGSEAAARLHLARTVCRRAERRVVALAADEPLDRWCVVYLNRLSDLLFALARLANHRAGVADVPWTAPR